MNINIQIQPNHYIVQRIEKEWKRVTQTVWGRVTNTRKDKLLKSVYQIHCRDKKEHTRLAKQCKRKEKPLMFKKLEEQKVELSNNKFFNKEIEVDVIENANESSSQLMDTKIDDGSKQSVINTNHFPLLAQTVLRYGTSNREAAAISSAVLIDIGIVNEKDNKLIIDHHKIHREKKKVMKKLQTEDLQLYQSEEIKALFFDGRNNLTLFNNQDKTTSKYYSKTIKMDFYTVTSEPGGKYVFHFSPLKPGVGEKSALMIAKPIADWCRKFDINLQYIGADSTAINTGRLGGVIKTIEDLLNKKLTWIICMLHTNKLPLRHLIQKLDGKTTSSNGFSGVVGKLLNCATLLPLAQAFPTITIGKRPIELNQDVIDDLSTDQLYGYKMILAIRSGNIPIDLIKMECGPVNHSRWLTTANRLMRIWVSLHGLSGENFITLSRLVEYVVGVYYPMWFDIKVRWSFIEGPRHVLETLRLVKMQNQVTRDIVEKYVISGAWFSHSEAVLATLLCSSEVEERVFAVDRILQIRKGLDKGETSVRERIHSSYLNIDAKNLTELCSWTHNVFEPIQTCSFTTETIVDFKVNPMVVDSIPCHTQSVERAVKQTTRACAAVYGHDSRDGFIRAGCHHRKLLPKNNTKKNLKQMII